MCVYIYMSIYTHVVLLKSHQYLLALWDDVAFNVFPLGTRSTCNSEVVKIGVNATLALQAMLGSVTSEVMQSVANNAIM